MSRSVLSLMQNASDQRELGHKGIIALSSMKSSVHCSDHQAQLRVVEANPDSSSPKEETTTVGGDVRSIQTLRIFIIVPSMVSHVDQVM